MTHLHIITGPNSRHKIIFTSSHWSFLSAQHVFIFIIVLVYMHIETIENIITQNHHHRPIATASRAMLAQNQKSTHGWNKIITKKCGFCIDRFRRNRKSANCCREQNFRSRSSSDKRTDASKQTPKDREEERGRRQKKVLNKVLKKSSPILFS